MNVSYLIDIYYILHMKLCERLLTLYSHAGAHAYFGEAVTTLEHSLQAAHFAQLANASNALVLAALLHDVGHLIASAPTDFAEWTVDARHEESGGRWLAAHFCAGVFRARALARIGQALPLCQRARLCRPAERRIG